MNFTIILHQRISRLIVCLLVLLSSHPLFAQSSLTYSNYMTHNLPLNTATSLLDQSNTITVLGRRQLTNFVGGPSTFLFDAAFPLSSIAANAGLLITDDKVAVEHLTKFDAFFAKSIQLGATTSLGVSLNAGIMRYSADYTSLYVTDPEFSSNVNQNRPNIGFSILLYSANYYIGLSAPDLTFVSLGTASVQSNSNFNSHYHFNAAVVLGQDNDIQFKPACLVTYGKGSAVNTNLSGTLYFKQTLGIGGNYNSDHLVSGILSYYGERCRIGYSYQFSNNALNNGSTRVSTQEILLTYRFGHYQDQKTVL